MPRPKRVSDEAVLTVAMQLLAERGVDFTLTDLASGVGLARATLIQRFGDRDAILERIARFEVAATRDWLATLPTDTGPDALWRFLQHIVQSMGNGDGFAVRVAIAAFEARQPTLRHLASERYALVQDAIAARLPQAPHRLEIACHLHAVIAGATMQWVASPAEVGLDIFVLGRLRWAVEQLGIDTELTRL